MADITQEDIQNLVEAIKSLVNNQNIEFDYVRERDRKQKDIENKIEYLKNIKNNYQGGDKEYLKSLDRELKELGEDLKLVEEKLETVAEQEERIAREREKIKREEENKVNKFLDSKLAKITTGVVEFAAGLHNIFMAQRKENLKEAKNAYDRGQKMFKADLELRNQSTQKMLQTLSAFTNQTATVASREIAAAARTEANSYIDYISKIQGAEYDYEIAQKQADIEAYKSQVETGVKMVSNIANLFGPYGKAVTSIVQGLHNNIGELYFNEREFDIEKLKQEQEVYQGLMDNVKGVADRFKTVADSFASIANNIVDKMMETDTIYKQSGLSMGFIGDQYSSFMRSIAPNLAATFNLDAQQLAEMQSAYTSASGRNVLFGQRNFEEIEAISRAFGMSRGEVGSFIGNLNVFNTSVSDTEDIMTRMYKTLTKMGLNTSKFSKELVQNMKLAEKYNFKSSVENMSKLTQWAQQTRFNLQSATSFADKMMSNNISDVLETTAQLQVLGGNIGLYADPFSMMYEASNDVGALAGRMASMIESVGGTFNSSTGDVTFGGAELRLARALSNILGQSVEDITNQRRKAVTQQQINYVLRGSNLSEEDKLAIGNVATYDKKDKKFKVTTTNNEVISMDEIKRMSPQEIEDLKKVLIPENEEKSLIDIVSNTRSLVEIEKAQLSQLQLQTGLDLWSTIGKISGKMLKSQSELYNGDTQDSLISMLNTTLNHQANVSDQSTKQLMEVLQKPEYIKGVEDYYQHVENGINQIASYSQAELGMLALIAEKDGVANMSGVLKDVARIFSSDSGDRASLINSLKQNYGNKERKVIEYLTTGDYGITDDYKPTSRINDGVGLLNGSYITNASHVKSINDGIVKTHIADEYMAAKPNGPIDKLFNGVIAMIQEMYDNQNGKNIGSSPLNISLNGRLDLSQNNSNINLVEIIKRDPVQSRDLIRILLKALDSTQNGKITEYHNI